MLKIRLKEAVKDEELLAYGFRKGKYAKHPDFIRQIDGLPIYRIYFTDKHRFMQVLINEQCVVAGTLQAIIYRLTKDGLLEEVEVDSNA